jgi:hypothetical protein
MYVVVFILVGLLTFTSGWIAHRRTSRNLVRIRGYVVHHSVVGVGIVLAGQLMPTLSAEALAAGTAIYLSHTLEEIVFNKVPLLTAAATFVTKDIHIQRDSTSDTDSLVHSSDA